MTVVTFNAREKHHKGKRVLDWYTALPKTERSRKIVDILYAHIESGEHIIEQDSYSQPFYNARGGSHIW
jgi:hypothetical protein